MAAIRRFDNKCWCLVLFLILHIVGHWSSIYAVVEGEDGAAGKGKDDGQNASHLPPKEEPGTSGGGGGGGEEGGGRNKLRINFFGDKEAKEAFDANAEKSEANVYKALSLRKARPNEQQLTHYLVKYPPKGELKHVRTDKEKAIDAEGVRGKIVKSGGNPAEIKLEESMRLRGTKFFDYNPDGTKVVKVKANDVVLVDGHGQQVGKRILKETKWAHHGPDGKVMLTSHETEWFDDDTKEFRKNEKVYHHQHHRGHGKGAEGSGKKDAGAKIELPTKMEEMDTAKEKNA